MGARLGVGLVAWGLLAQAGVVVHPAPRGMEADGAWRVWVAGQECFVAKLKAAGVCTFELTGVRRRAEVEIESREAVRSVRVRPERLGIRPKVEGRRLRFEVAGEGTLVVEVNGERRQLVLGLDGPEAEPEKPGAGGVRHFEGGRVHDAGVIEAKNGEIVYLAGGAVVYGTLRARGVRDFRLLGRGVFVGRVEIEKSAGVRLEGVTVSGEVALKDCERVRARGVRILEGLRLEGSREVTLERGLVRGGEDTVRLETAGRDVRRVEVRDSVLWGGRGRLIAIGPRLDTENVTGLRFAELDVIHAEESEALLSIVNAGRATVSGVEFDEIRAERVGGPLVEVRVEGEGHVEYLKFRKVRAEAARGASGLVGKDVHHAVEMVKFEGCRVGDFAWKSEAAAGVTSRFTAGVSFR